MGDVRTGMRTRRLALIVALTSLALAACGADAPVADGPAPTTTTATSSKPGTTPVGEPAGDRGWIGGAPDWSSSREYDSAEAPAMDMASGGEAYATDAPAAPREALPAPPGEGAPGPLRAGSVDDNADFARYLDYLARIDELGVRLRSFDPAGRIVVQVTGSDGLPVAGVEVHVAAADTPNADSTGTILRTTADGTARFHPALYGAGVSDQGYTAWIDGGPAADVAAGGDVTLTLDTPGGREAPIAVDVLFLLDATGSMGDEIDRLKGQIDSVAERVAALDGTPDVRFGMTLYRDQGDTFVTATRDFTADVQAFRADLAEVVAEGGGDYPEALEEGLAEALLVPTWRDPATTLQLVFLVADAPPQIGRQLDHTYVDSLREAVGRGLKIFPVASSESDDQAEAVFRQLAQGTGARFVFLTYGAGGAATGGSTDIATTDYEELALDDLVVRLVAEELAALTGDGSVVPPVTVPPPATTNPPGQ